MHIIITVYSYIINYIHNSVWGGCETVNGLFTPK